MKKSVVLLSSGLDSTFNLVRAKEESEVVLAITFNYSQRAAMQEMAHAAALCAEYKVPHKILELPWFRDFTNTSLVNTSQAVPTGQEVKIDEKAQSLKTAEKVWVPNRNGILLNIGAAYAEGLKADYLIPGFNIEEASTFPDNSQEYLQSLTKAFSYSTANKLEALCYSISYNKTQIVADLKKRNFNFSLLWPCYFSYEKWCGECESCLRFKRALSANGIQLTESFLK